MDIIKNEVKYMKRIDIFNKRRRGLIANNEGIVIMTVIFALIVIVGGIALLWVLSQIIIPLIILMVLVLVFAYVIKYWFGRKEPFRAVEAVGEAGVRYVKKGASWFERLIGGK